MLVTWSYCWIMTECLKPSLQPVAVLMPWPDCAAILTQSSIIIGHRVWLKRQWHDVPLLTLTHISMFAPEGLVRLAQPAWPTSCGSLFGLKDSDMMYPRSPCLTLAHSHPKGSCVWLSLPDRRDLNIWQVLQVVEWPCCHDPQDLAPRRTDSSLPLYFHPYLQVRTCRDGRRRYEQAIVKRRKAKYEAKRHKPAST